MRKAFETIALWKKVDIVFQCIVFAVMLLMLVTTSWSFFGLYLMGGAHLLSCIIWIIVLGSDIPKPRGGERFRKAVIIIGGVIGCSIILNGFLFIVLSLAMIIIGPLLGVSYFLQTLDELKYYSNARKPYYLL